MPKDDQWRDSRSGARAGAGFRYQDAVGVFLLVRCWRGTLQAEKITPESFDDFAIEGPDSNIWVQVKSKIAHNASFTPGEVARVILAGPGGDDDERWIVLDRPFATFTKRPAANAETISTDLAQRLCHAVNAGERERMSSRLRHTKVLIMPEPIAVAADEISSERNISRLAATACASELLFRVGEAASENARAGFAGRRSLTSASVKSYCDDVLLLMDSAAIEDAIKRGVVTQLGFDEPDNEPEFFCGVSAKPGHVVSGFIMPRPKDTEAITSKLVGGRDMLICGPSGAGKSALAYLSAFSTRHAIRWVEVRDFNGDSRESVLSFLRGLAPSPRRPVAVYVDDVGRGGEAAWEWLRSQARTIPGLQCLGSVREEDLSLVTGQYDVSIYRPQLSEELAASIWQNLRARDQSKAAYWREAFECSKGLMLEYVYMLTQGQRLHDVIAEQVDRRLTEHRDEELHVLPIVAAAGRCGTAVEIEALKDELDLTDAAFGRAYNRLRDEHLVGEREAGTLRGLHEIRSQTIYEVCLDKLALNGGALSERAARVVTPKEMRRYLAVTGREQALDDETTIKVLARRLEAGPSYHLFVEGLEALRLRTIMRDADVFHAIAKELDISHRHYMLCMLAMHGDLAKSFAGVPAFDNLNKFHRRFEEKRAADLRISFLEYLQSDTITASIEECSSPSEAVRLASALHGTPYQKVGVELVSTLESEIAAGDLEQNAEYLAILYESDCNASLDAAERLGGSIALLRRLWTESPWAVEPELKTMPDGSVELTANILAVGDESGEGFESRVNEYAGKALQLCPIADYVNARPLQLSGEALSIGGYTPGLKRLKHSVVLSKAAVSWNRMIIHTVASKYGAKSRTEVLDRYRFEIEHAVKQISRAIDFVCRGKKFNPKHRYEAMSLSVMEDILPTYPMSAPEDQLSNPLGADISDPIGTLIVSISEFLVALIHGDKTGHQLASYATDVLKSAPVVEAHPDWAYMESAPSDALSDIKERVSAFRPALVAAGHRRLRKARDVFTVRRAVTAGRGLSHMVRRLSAKWVAKRDELIRRVRSEIGAEVYAKPSTRYDSVFWPNWELCVLKPSTTIIGYYVWLDGAIDDLRELAQTADRLVVAPSFGDVIPAQLALRVYPSIPLLPEERFTEAWNGILSDHRFEESQTLKSYHRASNAMVSLYAAQYLLGEKPLLEIEMAQLKAWRGEAHEVCEQLTASASDDGNDCAEFALQQLVELNDKFSGKADTDKEEAVEYARSMLRGMISSEEAGEVADLIGLTMVLISNDLNLPLGEDESGKG